MREYKVRALEQHTAYQTTVYHIKANSEMEAKQILMEGIDDERMTHIESWDVDSDDYKFINQELWEVEDITEPIHEWQWAYKEGLSGEWQITEHMTEKEMMNCGKVEITQAEKIDQSKRIKDEET